MKYSEIRKILTEYRNMHHNFNNTHGSILKYYRKKKDSH